MRVSRQSNLPRSVNARRSKAGQVCNLPAGGSPPRLPANGARAFTLVELILVLVLLAITASLVGTNMGSFFRGRALNFEARRMLSLAHYAQSRAVSEGVPMVLWVNPSTATYGL